jgi:hypothetical protein
MPQTSRPLLPALDSCLVPGSRWTALQNTYTFINVWFTVPTGAGVAQSVKCLTTDWTAGRSRFDPRQKQKHFFSSLCVQTGSEAHSASCSMGTGGPFPGAKARPGRDADHSHLSSAEVVNE